MAIDAGSVFVRLGAHFEDKGFDKYDRALEQARKRKAVEAKLGADFNPKAFDAYERAMKETAARAKRKDAFKAELGGDFDNRAFRQYEKATKDVEKTDRDLVRSQGRVRTAFGNVYGRSGALFAAAGGLYGLAAAGKAVIGTASDINESLTKNQVLFGKYATDVEKFSDKSATSFGVSKKAALEYTGVFGNLFTSLGISSKESSKFSVNLTKLGADMASFNNTSIDEALEAIRAGLVGETEPLRKFGVNMNDATLKVEAHKLAKKGLISESKANAQTLDPETKALAAQSLIMKQTSSAHGDFKRTSGGLANQQRILKATISDVGGEIGKGLLPKVQSGVTWLNKFVKEMRAGKGDGGKFVQTLKDIWKEAEPIVTWIGRAAKNVAVFAGHHKTVTKLALAVAATGVAINAIKTSKAVSGIGTLLGALKKLAKTKAGETAASEIADGLGGVPGKGDKKMGRIRTWMRRAFGRAGASGGASAAAGSADELASAFGPNADKKKGKMRTALRRLFGPLGQSAGGHAADTAAGGMYAGTEGAFKARSGKFKTIFTRMGGWFGIITAAALAIELSKGLDNALRSWLDKHSTGTANKVGHGILDGIKRLGDPFGNATRPSGGSRGGAEGGLVTSHGIVRGYAAGGPVLDPRDTVPAMLTPGEFVMTPEATRSIGVGALTALNRKRNPLDMKGQLAQEARDARAGSKLVAAALSLVPAEAKKSGAKTGKALTDEIKDGTTTATTRVKRFRKDVGGHLDDLTDDGKKKTRKFTKAVTDAFEDTKDAASKRMRSAAKTVAARFDDITGDSAKSLRRLERTADQRFSAVASIGKTKGAALSRSVARSMGVTDSAVYTGLGYVSSATSEALKAFDAKPISLTVPRPKGIPGHATGGIPNPSGSAMDDHILVGPDGVPRAALSGTEGIINTPQMGVIDNALAVAKAVGASAFGGLGELWRSGMRHYAGGGLLARFARGGSMVRVPGDPDTTGGRDRVNSAIARDVAAWIRRFKIQIGYAFDPGGGHKSAGHNVTGTALDVVPGPGGTWDTVEAGLRAAIKSGKKVLYGTNGVGTPYPNHGRGNHAHVEWGMSGGVGGSAPDDIPKIMVRGTAGGMRSLAQAAINRARKGGNSFITEQAPDLTAGIHGPGGVGGDAQANMEIGRRMLGNDSQWPALKALWMGESGWSRTARNPSSGAYGIPQALPASKMGAAANPPRSDAGAQIRWGLGYISGRYGSPSRALAAWQARSPHWYSRGGGLRRFAAGGPLVDAKSGLPSPLNRLLHGADLPLPAGPIPVQLGGVNPYGTSNAATQQGGAIFLPRSNRQVLLHELGHHVDYNNMTGGARSRIMRLLNIRGAWRNGRPNSPHERFAEGYRIGANGWSGSNYAEFHGGVGYGYRASPRQQKVFNRIVSGLPGFATGGTLNRIVSRATNRVKGLKNRIKGFPEQIEQIEGRYHRLENDYATPGKEDEDYIIPATANSPARIDQKAIDKRTSQLDALVALRRKITMLYQREAKAMSQMIVAYRNAIARVRSAMRGAKSKDRPNYRKQIRSMESKIGAIRTDRTEVLNTESDQYLDLRELRAERKGLKGTAEAALAELAGDPETSSDTSDTSTGTESNPDRDAQLAQANERIRVLQETVRAGQANIGAFRGPGDIGSGGSTAFGAAYDSTPVGAGSLQGSALVSGSSTPLQPMLQPGLYLMRLDDPEAQEALAGATVGGLSRQSYTPTSRETV